MKVAAKVHVIKTRRSNCGSSRKRSLVLHYLSRSQHPFEAPSGQIGRRCRSSFRQSAIRRIGMSMRHLRRCWRWLSSHLPPGPGHLTNDMAVSTEPRLTKSILSPMTPLTSPTSGASISCVRCVTVRYSHTRKHGHGAQTTRPRSRDSPTGYEIAISSMDGDCVVYPSSFLAE